MHSNINSIPWRGGLCLCLTDNAEGGYWLSCSPRAQQYGAVGRVFGWLECALLCLSIVLCVAVFLPWAVTVPSTRRARLLHAITGPLSITFG